MFNIVAFPVGKLIGVSGIRKSEIRRHRKSGNQEIGNQKSEIRKSEIKSSEIRKSEIRKYARHRKSGGRLCVLIGVPWRGVSFSTFSTG